MTRKSAIVVSFISGLTVAAGVVVLMVGRFGGVIETLILLPILGISLVGLIDGAIIGRQVRQVWRGILGGIVGAFLGAIVAAFVAVLFTLGVTLGHAASAIIDLAWEQEETGGERKEVGPMG